MYPKYDVNKRQFDSFAEANQYHMVHGGLLMEKLDAFTPWHTLTHTPKES